MNWQEIKTALEWFGAIAAARSLSNLKNAGEGARATKVIWEWSNAPRNCDATMR